MNEKNTIPQKKHDPIDLRKMHLPAEGIMRTYHAHTGVILAILILFLLLIFVGLILWGRTLTKEAAIITPPSIINNEPETPRSNADVQILKTTSPSDELSAIETDLSSTNLDSLGTDLNQADRELHAVTVTP